MADYFTNFSCELKVHTAENAEIALEIYHEMRLEYGQEGLDVCFIVSVGDDPEALWIRDAGGGDTEHVIEFVRRCARALALTGRWGFEWANSYTKPQLGAHGGGAFILDLRTGQEVESVFTHLWLATRLGEGVVNE